MRKKIIEALKTKYKHLGFSEKAFDGVAAYIEPSVKEEADIETIINGVEALLKVFQGESDMIRTAKAMSEKKLQELEEQIKALGGGNHQESKEKNEKGVDDAPAWAKSLIEANKALSERINKMDAEHTSKTRKQQLSELIKKLPETYRKPYDHISLDSMKVEEFSRLIEDVTSEVDGILSETNAKGAVFGRPVSKKTTSGTGKEATDAEAQAVVDRINI